MNFNKLSKILCFTSILVLIAISGSLYALTCYSEGNEAVNKDSENDDGVELYTPLLEKDTDNDLISDDLELTYGTDPENVDTDGDGMWDGYEISCGKPNGGWQDPQVYNERYAILFVGGAGKYDDPSPGKVNNHGYYWNQLVLTYDSLIEGYGYKPENVFVFYADGMIPNPGNMHDYGLFGINLFNPKSLISHQDMIDFDANEYTIRNFLNGPFKGIITENDSLFFWVYDHGTYDDESACICCWDYEIYDYELYNYLKDYKYAQATIILGMCFSGGFLDPIKNTGTSFYEATILEGDDDIYSNLNDLPGKVIIMTSQDGRVSHSWWYLGFLFRFHQAITPRALDWKPNFQSLMSETAWYDFGFYTWKSPDKNKNHFISMGEAFEFARDNDDFSTKRLGNIAAIFDEHVDHGDIPQYYESAPGLGYKTYL